MTQSNVNKSNKLHVTLTLIAIAIAIVGGLNYVSMVADKKRNDTETAFRSGVVYTKGVITSMHSYKGQTVRINYSVNGKRYEYSGGWDSNPKRLTEGDSVSLKYAVTDPALAVSELDERYDE